MEILRAIYNVTAGNTYTFTARAFTGGGSGNDFDQHLTVWLETMTKMVYLSLVNVFIEATAPLCLA